MATPVKPSDPEGETKTTIDAFIDLLREKGKSELGNVAVSLGVNPRVVEKWAKVLETGGIVRISYEVGRMYIEPITITREEAANVKAQLDVRKAVLEDNITTQKLALDKFSESLKSLTVSVTEMETAYQKGMPEVQQMLAEINRVYGSVQMQNKDIENIQKNAQASYESMNKSITDLYAKISSFSSPMVDKNVTENTKKIEDIVKKVSTTENSLQELTKNKDKFFDTMMRSIDQQVKELKKQIEKASKDIGLEIKADMNQLNELTRSIRQQANSAKEITAQLNQFKKSEETARRSLDNSKREFADRYQKLYEEMERNMKLVDSNSKTLMSRINSIKTTFGSIASIDDTVRTLKTSIQQASRDIAEANTELTKLMSDFKGLEAMSNISVDQRANVIADLFKRSNKAGTKIAKIKKSIDETAEKLGSPGKGNK